MLTLISLRFPLSVSDGRRHGRVVPNASAQPAGAERRARADAEPARQGRGQVAAGPALRASGLQCCPHGRPTVSPLAGIRNHSHAIHAMVFFTAHGKFLIE